MLPRTKSEILLDTQELQWARPDGVPTNGVDNTNVNVIDQIVATITPQTVDEVIRIKANFGCSTDTGNSTFTFCGVNANGSNIHNFVANQQIEGLFVFSTFNGSWDFKLDSIAIGTPINLTFDVQAADIESFYGYNGSVSISRITMDPILETRNTGLAWTLS